MQYLSSSEWVSNAHPDRLADLCASIVINDIQKRDGFNSHAAIEVFLMNDMIVFSGEATTSLDIDYHYLRNVVFSAFDRAGYIFEMRKYWKKSECALPDDITILNKINKQSPDIALGTTNQGLDSGYNDVGIMFSSADNTTPTFQGHPMYVATLIGETLAKISRESILDSARYGIVLGPDIKVVVTELVEDDGMTPIEVKDIVISQCHPSTVSQDEVEAAVISQVKSRLAQTDIKVAADCNWVVNGTGKFVTCGCVSDTSMTGRKISVNHPSAGPLWSNKMIGGNSKIKPAHASDLILDLTARFIANILVQSRLTSYVIVGIASTIGAHKPQAIFIKGDGKNKNLNEKVQQFFMESFNWSPLRLAQMLGFFDKPFDFSKVVEGNFFGHPEKSQSWEDEELVSSWVDKLRVWLKDHSE